MDTKTPWEKFMDAILGRRWDDKQTFRPSRQGKHRGGHQPKANSHLARAQRKAARKESRRMRKYNRQHS